MTDKSILSTEYNADSSQLVVTFENALSSSDEDILDGIVASSYSLNGKKEESKNNIQLESEFYINGKYSTNIQITLNMLLQEAIRLGLSNREDYLDDWKDWIKSIENYTDSKLTDMEEATSLTELNAITWNFSETFDSTDPEVTIRGALSITDYSTSVQFEGYMSRISNTQIRLDRYNGRHVMVARELMKIPSSGASCYTTDNLITDTGADAGEAMSPNTLYYIYASNNSADPFPAQLRASTTAPSLLFGINKYLGTSGNSVNWRFVGWVYTNDNTYFKDNETQRLVVNQYNRKRLYGYLNPGYNDNDSVTMATLTNTNYQATAGQSKFEWIATGDDSIDYELNAVLSTQAGERAYIGIGEDSLTNAKTACPSPSGADKIEVSCGRAFLPTEGYHYLQILACVSGGTAGVFLDGERRGSSEDPRMTYASVIIFG